MEEVVIPNDAKYDVATYNLLVNGKEVDPSYKLLSLSVMKEVNRVPMAKIIIRDGDASKQNFEISNKDDFIPGNKIQINIGRDSKNATAFKGIITKHSVKVKANGHSQLLLECQDETVRMTIGRHSHYFEKVTDSQVFDELAKKYSIKTASADTKLKHKELVQHHISDWDFLILRAEANGMLVFVEDGLIKIAKPAIQNKEALQVNYGSSVLEFESEIDACLQLTEVKTTSWDYTNQKLFNADSSSSPVAEPGNIKGSDIASKAGFKPYEMHHSGFKTEQELQDWADGIMVRSRLSKIRGRARFTGFSAIKPGDTVKLSGVGDRFNGKAYVTAVRNDLGNGTWETQLQFGLDPERYAFRHQDMDDAPSAGLVGSIQGLQIGVVVQLQNDPDGQHRILVKVPVIDNKAKGIWTRVASLDAGNNRGAFFMPEIGDEVIVGFINADPRDAVMLGMLHSSAKPSPIKEQDANNEKGFTTRSKMHISFNDSTKTITIDTPAGNSIVLDEKSKDLVITDQNKNKITMNPTGIKMESSKNIDIKAGGILTLGAGISLAISGPALSIKADANVNIEGATAKLNAQGPLVINGLPVKIN